MELRIAHLYADLMNTYGDMGNIIALKKRSEWRGIKVVIRNVSLGNEIDPEYYDFYFFGGGQDWQQTVVAEDLQGKKADDLQLAKSKGAVFLAICGGYQLLGQYYQPLDGNKLYGAGIFDAYTKASSKRMIQNLIVELDPSVILNPSSPSATKGQAASDLWLRSFMRRAKNLAKRNNGPMPIGSRSFVPQDDITTLVGFENHSGQTFLGEKARPLGKVIIGAGNNGEDHTEGAIDGTAFGCYLHGSLLPKNPHFADYLILLALKRRYGEFELKTLDDVLEYQAHMQALARARLVQHE